MLYDIMLTLYLSYAYNTYKYKYILNRNHSILPFQKDSYKTLSTFSINYYKPSISAYDAQSISIPSRPVSAQKASYSTIH